MGVIKYKTYKNNKNTTKSSNEYNYFSEEENHEIALAKLNLWKQIKHFTLDDYFSCDETKEIIQNQWNDKYYYTMEENINTLFNSAVNDFQSSNTNILLRADKIHGTYLLDLIKHHVKREYDLDIFKRDPFLAEPLLEQYEEIQKRKENERKKNLEIRFINANRKYDWNKGQ